MRGFLLPGVDVSKDPDPTEKLFNYISLLEETNDQLLSTLKKCHTLLGQFISEAPDPARWMDLLDDLQNVISAGERAIGKKEVH